MPIGLCQNLFTYYSELSNTVIPTISFIRSGLLLKSGIKKVYEKALISEVYLLVYISQEEHRQAQAELCPAQTSLS